MTHTDPTPDQLADLDWRISSFSGQGSSCVAVAKLDDGGVAVRNSNHPDAGTVTFTHAEWAAFAAGMDAGEFDDLR
jgi:hypothetical protein